MRLLHALQCTLAIGALASVACGRVPVPPAAPNVIPAAFVVRMQRIQRPGDRGMVSIAVRTRRTTLTEEGDQIARREEESQDVELEAAEKVLRVDSTGEPLELEYTVEHLSVQTPAGRTEVLARGRVVIAERGREKVTFRSGEALSPEAERALGQILSPRSGTASDDDLLGTGTPQTIGAIWPVNAAVAARELGDASFPVPVEGVRGQTRLAGLAQVAGQTCLEITGELDARSPGIAGAPPGSREVRMTYRRLLPVDTAAPELDSALTVDMAVTVLQAVGTDREARTTTTAHQERRRQFTPGNRAPPEHHPRRGGWT